MKERKVYVEKFDYVIEYKNKKYQGYAFTNEYNRSTMIICYGESKRKSLIEMFSKNSIVIEL